jgi:hypothetical protein
MAAIGEPAAPTTMVRIVDVAEAAQVSAATVSRALNYSDRVDPALRSWGTDPTRWRETCVARALRCGR